MTLIGTAAATTSAPARMIFDRWADMATWPEWNTDTEWVRLDTPFAQGATGRLKPKGGPSVRFTVSELVPDRIFTDVSHLPGARLVFAHHVTESAGTTRIEMSVSMTGPLSALWRLAMAKSLRASLPTDLAALIRAVETTSARGSWATGKSETGNSESSNRESSAELAE